MSSACECHIEGAWCFYCEMYVPMEEAYEAEKARADKFRTQLAEWVCRHMAAKNTFHKANEMDKALREIRQIANEADLKEFVDIVDNVLGREWNAG